MIYVDLTGLCDRKMTGIENYAFSFFQMLLKAFGKENVVGLRLGDVTNHENCISLGKNKGRFVTEYFYLPSFLLKHKNDIFIYPIFPPAIVSWKLSSNIVPIIYDSVPWNYKNTMSFFAKLIIVPRMRKALKMSKKVITESETVVSELKEFNKECLYHIVYNCLEDKGEYKKTDILEKLDLKEKEYILSVSTLEPRKNFKYLLEIIKELKKINSALDFVLVGRKGWDKNLEELIKSTNTKLTGYISDDELNDIYRYAKCFIMLPINEGFGRTPVEAALKGTPVIVSDIPIFHETMGNQCYYLPLDNISEATKELSKILNNNKFIEPDKKYFEKFSYENVFSQVKNLNDFFYK